MRSWSGALAIMAVALAASAARGDEPGAETRAAGVEERERGLGAVDEGGLKAWAKEIQKSVEEIAGRAFTAEVDVRVVGKDELARVLSESVQEEMQKQNPGADATLVYVRSMKASYDIADRVLGVYNRKRKTVFVVVSNVPVLLASIASNRVLCGQIVRLTIVHEMVHALQDQHVPADALFAHATDHDSHLAVQCVVEGQAVVVTDAVAERLGWKDANAHIWALATGREAGVGADGVGKASGDERQKRVARRAPAGGGAGAESAMVYTRGRELARKRMHEGGAEGLWRLLGEPPRTMRAVMEEITPAPEFRLPEPTPEAPGKK